LYVFPAVPASWQAARFQDVRTEGAFLVSAERRAGRTAWVRIASTVDSHLRLAPPFAGAARLIRELGDTRQETTVAAELLEVDTHAGEMLYLLPVEG
ncbi:MAG: hypothetical protein GYA36_17605, partial [Veillonellaceae bacterium]|nr:hypothetical protein [Veillonellaceae bacterium]